ncbi:MAG: class I SAM-dependent methyltransferase [Nitrospiraceae bacterium]|nr:MAG: class I SAM-dependent methyltransferase [Nitrospiraceae bacterium]
MKTVIRYLADQPVIFNALRRLIEANYASLTKVIRKEFSLDLNRVKLTPKEKILDIPCGTGEFCTLFSPDCYQGLDISKKYIDYARNKYKRKFLCSDARHSGFSDEYFDKILMLGFLHHLDDSTVEFVLKEAKRILKPDGVLLLIEDAPVSVPWNIIGKVLQKYDIGNNIRPASSYRMILEKDFQIRRYYNIKSGFWEYSVFVMRSK